MPDGTGFRPDFLGEDNAQSFYFSNEQHADDMQRPLSPMSMPPGQIQGLESIPHTSLHRRRDHSPHSDASSLRLNIPGYSSPAELALAAMQYLPTPLIVLNALKTVVMANDAAGRLLGLEDSDGEEADDIFTVDNLRGKTLNQIGIDMCQDGR